MYAQVLQRFATKRPTSAQMHEIARRYLPSGTTRTVLDYDPFPITVTRADGCVLTDVDGHSYLDYLGDYSVGLAGHNPQPIQRAVAKVLDEGWSFGAVGTAEVDTAQQLCERFQSFGLVRFTSSGTEANLLAISLARYATGRSKLVVFDGGYHGGVLNFGRGTDSPNVPFDAIICDYNDVRSVEDAFNRNGGEIACVLVEPMLGSGGRIQAVSGFLAALRRMCDQHEAVLIFDEVQTSRMSYGGGQEIIGVTPDLTTVGKYLGGGFAFGAVGGRNALLSFLDRKNPASFGHSGTFNNNRFAMAASAAVLREIATREALASLFDRGEALRAAANGVLKPHGFQATGWGSLMGIHPTSAPLSNAADLAGVDRTPVGVLFHEMLDRGIYIGKSGFVTLSLPQDERTDDLFLEALSDSMRTMEGGGLCSFDERGLTRNASGSEKL